MRRASPVRDSLADAGLTAPPAAAGRRRARLVRIAVGRRAPDSGIDLLWSASALLLLAAGLVWPILGAGIRVACPFRAITGIPCPTCGATRAVIAFAHLDLMASLAANPLVFVAACASAGVVAYAAAWRIGIIPRISVALEPAGRGAARILIAIAVLAQWIYLIGAGL
ncbi:MAG: DUF2752 domain-containing protein [Planctomycetes bacterium]|nr:DUF2752 domain-containing protein [Planctomycetota bacterium]